MRKSTSLVMALIAVATMIFLAAPSRGQEPKYLHALSNLRAARGWINSDHRPGTKDARRDAVKEIDRAIDEVKKAAHEDGKSTEFTPPPHGDADPWAPLRTAVHLLDDAYGDVKYGRDIPENAGLQARALEHIGMARSTIAALVR